MRKIDNQKTILVLLIFHALFLVQYSAFSQGQFVRGVEKVEFQLKEANADFYVSTKGNDNWSGTLAEPNIDKTDGPFATVGRARKAVADLKKTVYKVKKPPVDKRFIGTPHRFGSGKDILVLIREGVYNLEQPLVFSTDDGGERVETDLPTGAFEYHELKDYFVTYAAYPGENPVLSGGKRITGWTNIGKNKWSVRLNKDNIDNVYANGQRLMLARTPNSGYFLTGGQPTDSTWFNFKGKEIQNWENLKSGILHMVVRWSKVTNSIRAVDTKKKIAWLQKPSPDILYVPPRYYIENMEELMDTVGEWYFDKSSKTLSLIAGDSYPNPNTAEIIIPELNNLVTIKGTKEEPVRNLRFYNLSFRNTSEGGDGTIFLQYVKNCEVLKNSIENVSQTAIRLGIGCYHNTISRNNIHDVRGSGIVARGEAHPQSWNDMISDNLISYNKVMNTRPAATGISAANTLRTKILHNYVSNTGSYGITMGAWVNIEETCDGSYLAEYNHVSYSNMERDDEGGIAVYGLSPGSVVRRNVVHDVHPAATNENVGFFFQNMSMGWNVSDNVFFNLTQGEMKLCACYLTDNIYSDNFMIESPEYLPEEIIEGMPDFTYENLQVQKAEGLNTGDEVIISTEVFNHGATGIEDVFLYVDGKVVQTQKFPVVKGNKRTIQFKYKFCDPGSHSVAIGTTGKRDLKIGGKPLYVIFRDMELVMDAIPEGDSLKVTVKAENMREEKIRRTVTLQIDGKNAVALPVEFEKREAKKLIFSCPVTVGKHMVTIEGLSPCEVNVYPVKKIDISKSRFLTYCSTTALPCNFEFSERKDHFEITASGTDFLHAEDSYGAIYLNKLIEGNFVATVKVVGFSKDISEWFRAGIFVRNDIAKSHTSEPGSLGSFLLFSTTKRCGAEWDEFANGCMHNTKSKNYGVENPLPVWLKLVRHGNRFSGYYSFDGKNWILSRESGEIPGLALKMDIGLAGGANDQRPSTVMFEDFQLLVEKH